MVRTQIQLTERQHRQLKKWANRLGISLSEAVRRCVEERLAAEERAAGGREERVRAALAVVGKYADPEGPSPVGKEHDRHFAEAARR
jgi:hypothetical protein